MEGKKALLIIANKDFQDEEYQVTREVLESEGIEVKTASSAGNVSEGSMGTKVSTDYSFSRVITDDFDAVIFIGGMGAEEYSSDDAAIQIARDAHEMGKVVGGICIAPVILANAGLLTEKRATVAPAGESTLKAKKAFCSGKDVESTDRVVTANGPRAAEKFAREIVKKIS